MRRPYIEAAALLATIRVSARPDPTLSPFATGPYRMPTDARYALVPRLDNVTKPLIFADLASLARAIERRRAGRGLWLEEVETMPIPGSAHLHRGVKVWATNMAHDPEDLIGFAWLNEKGRETLEPALYCARWDAERAAQEKAA